MMRKSVLFTFILSIPLLTGCHGNNYNASALSSGIESSRGGPYFSLGPSSPDPSQRFVQTSHTFEVLSPESSLPDRYQSLLSYCASIRCEVQNCSIRAKSTNSPPYARISLRVHPQDSAGLFARIEKQGRILSHETSSKERTGDVLDSEAKLKNLTAFRDNLRKMLTRPSASVRDSLDIQKKLTDVQTELDAETARRKTLANETETVSVYIVFFTDRANFASGGFADLANAFRKFGSVLAGSTAAFILAVAAVLPWLTILLPGCWILVRLWRKRKARKAAAPPSSPLNA